MSGALAAAAIGTGLSLYQGAQAQKQAKSLASEQQRRADMAEEQARRQYEEEQALYRPAKERLMGEAMAETPMDYGKYVDLVHQKYGDVLRQGARSPIGSSGLGAARVQGAQLAQASDLARAYTEAKDRQRALLAGLIGQDKSAALGQGYVGTLGRTGEMYGQQAAIAGGLAGQAYGDAARGITGMATELGRRYYQPSVNTGAYSNQTIEPVPTEPLNERIYGHGSLQPPTPTDIQRGFEARYVEPPTTPYYVSPYSSQLPDSYR